MGKNTEKEGWNITKEAELDGMKVNQIRLKGNGGSGNHTAYYGFTDKYNSFSAYKEVTDSGETF